MTKLVRKLKQMAKKRSHRNAVQKRKAERIQRDLERTKASEQDRLERETDKEMARLTGAQVDSDYEDDVEPTVNAPQNGGAGGSGGAGGQGAVRVVGGLVLEAAPKKSKKQLSRKQAKRQERNKERGEAITDMIAKKWDHKKRRVKARAQIRNENLH